MTHALRLSGLGRSAACLGHHRRATVAFPTAEPPTT
eukprot:CAMPEP_0185157622 /NCGR_PEP_ID=MMETSP1139-20130426/1890_1 /TAXON_ID=298111 /ORGANISM="Pavlova sp., Strain CCMP459" /LENGTH=35 /DNA_ID= /DNA_START= /DNA_END= /DNA_ORIENTATION=